MSLPDHVVLVTGNAGKAEEMRAALDPLGIAVAQDTRGYPEIQHDRLSGVAEAGAGYLLATGLEPPFVLEDAGLFVSALKGFPGVYSRHALDTIGIGGILALLSGLEAEMRQASFQACLLYLDADRKPHAFAGTCKGRIAERARGEGGFGFDPVFVPDEGDGRTFAEMGTAEKTRISHRGRAVAAFTAHLSEQANR